MGYMCHHAIVVTTYKQAPAQLARAKALELFKGDFATLVSEAVINGYYSFAIFPDGSKEGWQDSDQGDTCRAAFIAWLKAQEGYDWVEVQYGDDELETCIVDDSDAERRAGPPDTPLLTTDWQRVLKQAHRELVAAGKPVEQLTARQIVSAQAVEAVKLYSIHSINGQDWIAVHVVRQWQDDGSVAVSLTLERLESFQQRMRVEGMPAATGDENGRSGWLDAHE